MTTPGQTNVPDKSTKPFLPVLPNSRLARRPSNEKQISKIKKEFFQGTTQGYTVNFSKHLYIDLELEIDRLFGDVKRSALEVPARPVESNMKHRNRVY